jgi:hypothetical protein
VDDPRLAVPPLTVEKTAGPVEVPENEHRRETPVS